MNPYAYTALGPTTPKTGVGTVSINSQAPINLDSTNFWSVEALDQIWEGK